MLLSSLPKPMRLRSVRLPWAVSVCLLLIVGAVGATAGSAVSAPTAVPGEKSGSGGYLTYLGGSGNESAVSMAVDARGAAYVVLSSMSKDFPDGVGDAGPGVVVVKVSPDGRSVEYASRVEGLGAASDIAVDAHGAAYVVGTADVNGAPARQNVLVAKLTAGGRPDYSRRIGGKRNDTGQAIAVDANGAAYVTGRTNSADFPVMGAAQPTIGGRSSNDAFVTKLDGAGAVVYSTFLGGGGLDKGTGIAVGPDGEAYVTGSTTSNSFPTVDPVQDSRAVLEDAFLTVLDPTGSQITFSTFLGGRGVDEAAAVAVDRVHHWLDNLRGLPGATGSARRAR